VVNSGSGTVTTLQWGVSGDIPVPADFDGDGRTEFAIFRPSTGQWYIRYSSTQTAAVVTWGASQDFPVAGDYDGDGRADVAVFRPSEGLWYIRYSRGGTGTVAWGTVNDVPVAGDYDGDGRADIAVFRPSAGIWYFRYATGATAFLRSIIGASSISIQRPPGIRNARESKPAPTRTTSVSGLACNLARTA